MLTGQLYQLTSPVIGSDAFELPVDQATSKWPSACRHDFPFSVYFKGKWSVKVIKSSEEIGITLDPRSSRRGHLKLLVFVVINWFPAFTASFEPFGSFSIYFSSSNRV